MATTAESQRVQPSLNQPEDSTQRGCTSWLLLSCIILTITTSFVFGWGLGAPNMYNDFTEPFLKGKDPCLVQNRPGNVNQQKVVAPAAAVPPRIVNNNNVVADSDNDIVEAEVDEDGNDIVDPEAEVPAESKQTEEPFRFLPELIKGIPQTVFLIGAFIGAITGPFWSNLFDRKRTVFANYIFCFASSLCVLLAYYFSQPWLFYLSRLLLGYQGRERLFCLPLLHSQVSIFRWYGLCRCSTIHWRDFLTKSSWCSWCSFSIVVNDRYPLCTNRWFTFHCWIMYRLGLGSCHCLLITIGWYLRSISLT